MITWRSTLTPTDLARKLQLADGTDIIIRPIRPEDAEIEPSFVRNLSKESSYMRFMQAYCRGLAESWAGRVDDGAVGFYAPPGRAGGQHCYCQ